MKPDRDVEALYWVPLADFVRARNALATPLLLRPSCPAHHRGSHRLLLPVDQLLFRHRSQGNRLEFQGLHPGLRGIQDLDTRGLFKLVAEAETGKLLGAHVLADQAGEVIQAATLAIKFGLRVQDLVETFHPYLTMVEGLKLAALTFDKDVSKLSCCAT